MWTDPTTRTTGEKITDTIWNVDVVDNLQYLYDMHLRYACVADYKAVAGGDFTSGAWRTRDINTEVYNGDGILSIAANQITLTSGTYRCSIACPAYRVTGHQARLYNITDSAVILLGTSEYSFNTTENATSKSLIFGQFTLLATKVLEIQHICTTSLAAIGFGRPSSSGASEVYTVAQFWRLG